MLQRKLANNVYKNIEAFISDVQLQQFIIIPYDIIYLEFSATAFYIMVSTQKLVRQASFFKKNSKAYVRFIMWLIFWKSISSSLNNNRNNRNKNHFSSNRSSSSRMRRIIISKLKAKMIQMKKKHYKNDNGFKNFLTIFANSLILIQLSFEIIICENFIIF